MKPYLDLLRDVLDQGRMLQTGTILESTGEGVCAITKYNTLTTYPLTPFPMVTTRRVSMNVTSRELEWFLSGSTNIKDLQKNNVHIWDQWADEDGNLGSIYGASWRSWRDSRVDEDGILYEIYFDQFADFLDKISDVVNNPKSRHRRRLVLSAWHASRLGEMRILPCHCIFQIGIDGGRITSSLYQRSCDLFLGCPYNVASYSLLTCLIAKQFGLVPVEFGHHIFDAHIYTNHIDQVREQLTRKPLQPPILEISPEFTDVLSFKAEQVKLVGYRHHEPMTGEVAV